MILDYVYDRLKEQGLTTGPVHFSRDWLRRDPSYLTQVRCGRCPPGSRVMVDLARLLDERGQGLLGQVVREILLFGENTGD